MAGGSAEYQRQRDPLHQFASQQTPKRSFRHCRIKSALIHKTANKGVTGRVLSVAKRLQQFAAGDRQALQLRGENAELYAALATCFITRPASI